MWLPARCEPSRGERRLDFDVNYRVYGARKIWRELNRQGHAVARCSVERLMRELGIAGAVRDRKVITTIADPAAERAPDRLDRDFVADAPNRAWVADFTHVAAWAGTVCVAFVVDTFSRSPAASSAGPRRWAKRPDWSWTHWRWLSGSATATATRTRPAS